MLDSQAGPSKPEQLTAIDASNHVSFERATIHVSDSATASFLIGAQIQPERPAEKQRVENLRYSHNAEYNMTASSNRGPCTPDTRTAVLRKLLEWCQFGNALLYWLSGMAGTGKTTIAFSLCELLRSFNLLAASFFCSRSLPDCRDIRIILPTIAIQLARRYPMFGDALTAALNRDPDILQRGLGEQLRTLIIDPWVERKEDLPDGVVVVLDALDECNENHAQFLQLLFDNLSQLPFKIFITSRPEFAIRDAMRSKDPEILSTFVLHEVENDLVRADIVKYLTSQLSHRTTPGIIDHIADLAGSSFIYASTVAKLCVSGNFNILARLQLLQTPSPTHDKLKMMTPLDELYKGVLTAILSDELLEIEKQEIKSILDTVVCAREPLSRRAIAELREVEEKEVERLMESLHSIIAVPQDSNQPITVLHASLPDFLLDPSRSGNLGCDPLSINLQFTRQCMAIMNDKLQPNICQVDGRPPNEAIDSKLIEEHIHPGLRYAVIYFTEHWTLCGPREPDRHATLTLIRHFSTNHMLCWIECLSLLRKLTVGIRSLDMILALLDEDSSLAVLIYDFLRLIQYAFDLLTEHALEIYSSALAWAPPHSLIRTHYPIFFQKAPRVLYGVPDSWTGPERIINIHRESDSVSSITISERGDRLALGASDGVVRIWNMDNQIQECTLVGHTAWINAVAISRDGDRVTSGSDDYTLRVWDIATRQSLFTVTTESEILTVAFSTDEKRIASGNKSCSVHVWDAGDGSLLHSLDGLGDWVTSVSFVPKKPDILLGPSWIWNIQTGEKKGAFGSHISPIHASACSLDGETIITGSQDNTARLWDTSGKELQVLQGHTDWVCCMAFLPGGKRAVTGSKDGTLRVWDVSTGDAVHTFTQSQGVESVAVFPHGLRLASCSGSRISLWNLRDASVSSRATQKINDPPDLQVMEVIPESRSVAFSSNGKRMLLLPSPRILDTETLDKKATIRSQLNLGRCASLSSSGRMFAAASAQEVEVWILSEGGIDKHLTLKGHTNVINTISFSHDERLIVTGSWDCYARFWDVATGDQRRYIEHPLPVIHISFSHDDTQIITSVYDAISIWSISGELLRKLTFVYPHTVYFTSDDQHFIMTNGTTISIFASHDFQLCHIHEGYYYWHTLEDGSSCAFRNDGWIYHLTRFGDQPKKLLWIPPTYQPHFPELHRELKVILRINGPLFSIAPAGIQVCLPRRNGLVTLVIPRTGV